ncbi:hypothetical protein B188_26830 [Candidatus Brocadiaceae bacterium B188]|nr:hypothetical protein B188_26830 [Candidatus Brocadiaceae bacterium B188]
MKRKVVVIALPRLSQFAVKKRSFLGENRCESIVVQGTKFENGL